MKGDVIDPETGLPSDLEYHVNLLADIVLEPDLQRMIVERSARKVGNTTGLEALIGMLMATQPRLGQGWTPAWWSRYGHHVRTQLATVLEDKEVRRAAGMFLAWKRGAPYRQVLKELRDLQRDLKNRIELIEGASAAGLVIVES